MRLDTKRLIPFALRYERFKYFLATALIFFAPQIFAVDRTLSLPDHLQQGQLVIGHVAHDAKVEFAGRRVRVGDDGVFVIGLERDAPAQVPLNVRFSNDKLLSMGMPKPPRFTDYIARCVQTTQGLTIPEQMAVDFK